VGITLSRIHISAAYVTLGIIGPPTLLKEERLILSGVGLVTGLTYIGRRSPFLSSHFAYFFGGQTSRISLSDRFKYKSTKSKCCNIQRSSKLLIGGAMKGKAAKSRSS